MGPKKLVIEWRHLDRDGDTCERCADTGVALESLVVRLAAECRCRGWDIQFKKTRLGADEVAQSNLILLNGRPIEDVLPGATKGGSQCDSCCEFTGHPTRCRTVEFQGRIYEALPETLIREAVCRVAHCC